MPTLNEVAAELLVTWTDPKAIGAAIVAFTLIVVVAVLVNQRRTQAAGTGAGPSGGTASASPQAGQPQPTPSTPDQLKQRAEASGNPLAKGEGETVAEMLDSEAIDDTELLSRFVRDAEGEEMGETMTVTEEEVVIKRDEGFFAVDPDAVIEKDGNLLLDPNVDWEEAEERGESWREANLDRMEYDEEGMPEG